LSAAGLAGAAGAGVACEGAGPAMAAAPVANAKRSVSE
jgi:hypothetical protein